MGQTPQIPVVLGLCRSVGRWVLALPGWCVSVLILGVGVIRSGPMPIGPEWVGWLRSAGESLPSPSQYLSSSLGPSGLMRLLGSPGDGAWWLLGGLLWICVFGVPIVHLVRAGALGRLIAIGIAASPAFGVTVTMLGHYDLWIITGSALVALNFRWWATMVGAVVAVLGNPEQAVPSAVALLLVALAWRSRSAIIAAAVYLVAALVGFAGAFLWASTSMTESRSGAFLSLVVPSLEAFLGVWPLAVYAWLGPLWIVVVVLLSRLVGWRQRLLALLGVIAVPGLMSITTLDGTRVFVAVGTGALVLMVVQALRGPLREWQPSEALLGGAALGLTLMPSVIVDTAGTLRLPYSSWIEYLRD